MTGIPLFSVEDQLRLRDQRTSTPNFLEIKTTISKQKPAASQPILAGYIINTFYSLFCRLKKLPLKPAASQPMLAGYIINTFYSLFCRLKNAAPKPAASQPVFLTSIIPHISPLCQSLISFPVDLWYNGHAVDSLQQRGGARMEYLISFLISVGASIVAYYICKWLDGDE